MKFGIRKPSITRSVKSRTSGRLTRSLKKASQPLYGKPGTGIFKHPKKKVYNKVYGKTSIGIFGILGLLGGKKKRKRKLW